MVTYDLTPSEVAHAFALKAHYPALSAHDCFCLVTTVVHSGILLTGDAMLRRTASNHGIRVHGVLWIVDQLEAGGGCDKTLLIQALETWQGDKTVYLPEHEVSKRLQRLSALPVALCHTTLRSPRRTCAVGSGPGSKRAFTRCAV